MYALIFRNWKFALFWVISISFSVATFLEQGGGKDRMEASAQQIRASHQAIKADPAPIASEPSDDEAGDDDEPARVAPVRTFAPVEDENQGDGGDGPAQGETSDPANG